jgi:uncharacterized protein (TIGR03435 family)
MGWVDRFLMLLMCDAPGTPNLQQIQRMFQKLLADRLQLRFHHEKREMSTYVLTVAKSGPKLTLSSEDPNGYHSLLGLTAARDEGAQSLYGGFRSPLAVRHHRPTCS